MPEEDLRKEIYNHGILIPNILEKIKSCPEITAKNKELILGYKAHSTALGLSLSRQEIQLQSLYRLATSTSVDFDKMAKKDVEAMMSKVQEKKFVVAGKERTYSAGTIETAKGVLKAFFRWMYGLESQDRAPEPVRWLKKNNVPNNLTKEDLLTKQEIAALINATKGLMGKALISVLYESAGRCGEVLQMRIKDVTFKGNYAVARLRGKMEKKSGNRPVFFLNSYDLLRTWVKEHPFKDNPNHPMWVVTNHMKHKKTGEDMFGKVITLRYLDALVERSKQQASLAVPSMKAKRVYPYLCRHSMGTKYYGTIGEALAKKQMGHSPNTRMAAVYNHLNDDDVLNGLKKTHGLPEEKKEEESLQIETCPRCQHVNSYGATTCSQCGMCLTVEEAKKQEAEEGGLRALLGDPTMSSKLEEFLNAHFEEFVNKKFEQMKADFEAKQGKNAEA